jgi:hypothetical protein
LRLGEERRYREQSSEHGHLRTILHLVDAVERAVALRVVMHLFAQHGGRDAGFPAFVPQQMSDSGEGVNPMTKQVAFLRQGPWCSECLRRLEDVRLELIFAGRFAAPRYYTGSITRVASPLTYPDNAPKDPFESTGW